MAIKDKKAAYGGFLKPTTQYSDNQKNLRSIFIDRTEDDLKPEPESVIASLFIADHSISNKDGTKEEELTQIIANETAKNLTQTKHKVDTNLTQEPDTNQTQSAHKPNTKQTQTKHKVHTKLNTQKTQSTHKVDTNLTQTTHISTLIGVQRIILLFIFEECKKARSHITEPLSIIHIISHLKIAAGSVKTSVARLCEKGFLTVNSFKNGRGGWSVYEIPDSVYKELLQMETQHKLHTNYTQSRHKLDTKPNTQLNTNGSSSSSDLINRTTTELSGEWNFDITAYSHFGFSDTQLKQIASLGVISASDVEQSLIELNFDIKNGNPPKSASTILNLLMGLLRKGQRYVSEAYVKDQDAAILEMAMREKAKQEKLLESKFVAWEAKLTILERQQVRAKMPPHLLIMEKSHGISDDRVRRWYFDYYVEKSSIEMFHEKH